VVRRTAEQVFIPLTVGGGVRATEDVNRLLRAGADKVSINTAAVERPALLGECAKRFGAQCVVASIDAKSVEGVGKHAEERWEVYVRGGRQSTGLDAIAWATDCVRHGAGEILLTSIDRDGARTGYDVALTRAVVRAVDVPVVASGGAGSPAHVRDVFRDASADAALVAGILHDGVTSVGAIKALLAADGLAVRGSGAQKAA
jgi:cyclase